MIDLTRLGPRAGAQSHFVLTLLPKSSEPCTESQSCVSLVIISDFHLTMLCKENPLRHSPQKATKIFHFVLRFLSKAGTLYSTPKEKLDPGTTSVQFTAEITWQILSRAAILRSSLQLCWMHCDLWRTWGAQKRRASAENSFSCASLWENCGEKDSQQAFGELNQHVHTVNHLALKSRCDLV